MAILPKFLSNLRGTLEQFFGTSGGFEGGEIDTPITDPAAGKRWLYPKTNGWYEKGADGIETKLGEGTEHRALTETVTQATHGFAVGDCVRMSATGDYVKSQADSGDTSDVDGMVSVVTDSDNFTFVHPSSFIGGLSGLTAGTTYYLSATTAGGIEDHDPSGDDPGYVSKPILQGWSEGSGMVLGVRAIVQDIAAADPGIINVMVTGSSTNYAYLVGVVGTDRSISVNGEVVQIDNASPPYIITDSVSHFVITGTTTVSKSTDLNTYTGNGSDGNAYNAYGLFHLYVCNSADCWNFESYDRRGSVIISPNIPTIDGYLGASGDGLNARHVGWVFCNASRQIPNDLCIVSRFNGRNDTNTVSASTNIPDLDGDANPYDYRDTDATMYILRPPYSSIIVTGQANLSNPVPYYTSMGLRILYGATQKGQASLFWAGQLTGLIYSDIRHVHFSESSTGVATVENVKLGVMAGYGEASSAPSFYADQSSLTVQVNRVHTTR